jgi:hypothetical protein
MVYRLAFKIKKPGLCKDNPGFPSLFLHFLNIGAEFLKASETVA